MSIGLSCLTRAVRSLRLRRDVRAYAQLRHPVRTHRRWLRPGGKLFTHVFVNRDLMYPFETHGDDNWLGRHFFTGGLMPAADTLLWFQRDLQHRAMWHVPGTHYQRTANHWLRNQDRHADKVMDMLQDVYGAELRRLWFQRWRMFWMACAELFGYDRGQEWFVAHYRFIRHT